MSEKLKIITSLLIKKTRLKQLSWEQENENAYALKFHENKFVINNYFASLKEKQKVNLLVYNSKNEMISSSSEDNDKNVRDLYKLANDNYFNIDETMDKIIHALL